MPLDSGTTLGPYQIESPLGAGGMGEVYKARDTRLDRTVAIKVLPEHVAADPDLKQRFEREARTIAALNHPHICTLHDIGSQDGIDFLVMEYLDGQTLAQRLEKGALPLDQALQIAIDIADALDKAHRQGIVHRDLKPANIMLTKAGAKLLDFGLAKLKPPEQAGGLSALPTQPADLTQEGAILGTFQYMAPEQLEGQEADARTDIFAFGTMVYEMVTGRKAFEGKSQASLIAAILEREPPPMSELRAMSPPFLDPIVKTCLAKDPEDRWQSVGDIGRQLQVVMAGGTRVEPAASSPPDSTVARWQRPVPLVLMTAVVVAIAAILVMWPLTQREGAAPDLMHFAIIPPDDAPLPRSTGLFGRLAILPDGSEVIYRDRDFRDPQLYRRPIGQDDVLKLPGASGVDPFVSPDGAWIGFQNGGALYRVSMLGGPPVRITQLSAGMLGASWGADD